MTADKGSEFVRVRRDALQRARDTAMEWTVRGRIPECGEFGGIAQDLDAMLSAAPPAESQPQGVEDVEMGAFYVCPICRGPGVVTKETHDEYSTPAAQIAAPGNVEPLPRATVKLVVSLLRHRRDSLSNDAAAWLERFAALRSQEPAYGPDGSMSIHYQQDGCQMYKHPPECWSQGQAVAVGDAMVERACRAYFPGWETFHPEAWKAPRRLGMRAAITAALAQQANKEQPPNA